MKKPLNTTVLVGCSKGFASRLALELNGLDAIIEATFPDGPSAVDGLLLTLAARRTFLVHVKTEADLPALRVLADTFGGQPILALVEGGADDALLAGAYRQGACQIVPLPLNRDVFQLAMRRVSAPLDDAGKRGMVVAIAGVTGGCGATAIAANLAYEAAHLREGQCLLVELSLPLGKLAHYFDIEPVRTTQDLFRTGSGERLELAAVAAAVARIEENFGILTGPYRDLTPMVVDPAQVARLVECTRRLADLVVLDVPCTLDTHYFEALTAADRIVLVCEQKIPSLHSLKLVCDALDRRRSLHSPSPPRVLVVNRYNPKTPGLSVAKLEEVLETTGFQTISNDFASMNATLDHGRPLRILAPRSRALADIHTLIASLFPELGPARGRTVGVPFFSRLSGRAGRPLATTGPTQPILRR